MLDGTIVLITDRPDNSLSLQTELSRIATCKVVRLDAKLDCRSKPLGMVADVTLGRREAFLMMKRTLSDRLLVDIPVICLLRSMTETALQEARNLGATLCLSALTPPTKVAQALFEQTATVPVAPELRIERGIARATEAIAQLFDGARAGGPIAMASVDASLEPILSAVREGGLNRWLDTVWTHDDATYQHCLLVAGVAAKFSLHLGFGVADRHHFVRAALLHDVGKARIPLAILNKPGRLDPDETTVMRRHPVIGYEILQSSDCDALTLSAVRHHHEMLDGSGYPDGLSGDAIGDTVRLLTICDIYAALTEKRSYKPAMPNAVAMAILADMTGRLEGGLVQTFGMAMTAPA